MNPKLPLLGVSGMQVNGLVSKQAYETVDYCYPFSCIGVTSFWHQLEQYRESNTIVSDSKGKDINIGFSKLPVGPVHGERIRSLMGKQANNKPCYYV